MEEADEVGGAGDAGYHVLRGVPIEVARERHPFFRRALERWGGAVDGCLTRVSEPSYVSGVSDKRTVTLEIAGAKYRMTSDAEEEHLQSLAHMINERIDALGPKAQRTATPAQLLAVVALGLADDLLGAERGRREIEQLTRDAVKSALDRIDERLAS